MPNHVKYSTSPQTLALKKGNFHIRPIKSGPTSGTGFWSGINPPGGGYVVYLNKASAGPAVYVAANDAGLVAITNLVAGASYTTAAQCLSYYAGQSDKMALNKCYPSIIINNLLLNLDSRFIPSYPTTGTTWYDIGPSGNNGSLINGVVFTDGSMLFDGINDYVTVGGSITNGNFTTNEYTLSCWFAWTGVTGGSDGRSYLLQNGGSNFPLSLEINSRDFTPARFATWENTTNGQAHINSTTTVNSNQWYHFTVLRTGSTIKMYVDGAEILSTASIGGNLLPFSGIVVGTYRNLDNRWFSGKIDNVKIYNRGLSQQEVLQNYYQASIATNGLVLALDASNTVSYSGSGTSWYDLTPSDNNGILVNGTAYETETGGTLVFDGTDDYVNVPYSASLAPTAALSFEAWAWKSNWNANQVNQRILSKTQVGGYQLSLNEGSLVPPGNIGISCYYGGAYRSAYVANSTIPGGWNHFAGTCDGRYLRFYVNGVNVQTYDHGSQTVIAYSVNNSLLIGAEPGSGSTPDGQYFSGKIAAVRVYNRALSTAEIYSNFSAQSSRFGL